MTNTKEKCDLCGRDEQLWVTAISPNGAAYSICADCQEDLSNGVDPMTGSKGTFDYSAFEFRWL